MSEFYNFVKLFAHGWIVTVGLISSFIAIVLGMVAAMIGGNAYLVFSFCVVGYVCMFIAAYCVFRNMKTEFDALKEKLASTEQVQQVKDELGKFIQSGYELMRGEDMAAAMGWALDLGKFVEQNFNKADANFLKVHLDDKTPSEKGCEQYLSVRLKRLQEFIAKLPVEMRLNEPTK